MKKNLLSIGLVACTACVLASPAFCDDNIFGDLTTTTPPSTSDVKAQTTVQTVQTVSVPGAAQMQKQETLTTQSLQTTISSLEAAQTDLRGKLETAKTNYAAVSQEYLRVKNERAALKKIVKCTEKRIKTLENTKKKIQKAMQISL